MSSKKIKTLLVGCVLLAVSGCAAAVSESSSQGTYRTLEIGGSSETYEVLEALAEGFEATASDVDIKFAPSSQTSAGIQGVKSSALDIGGVSRSISEAETQEELRYVPLAKIPLVMVVHESVTGVSNITADQIRSIYSGEISNWQEMGGPDAAITLLDFTEDENEKKILRQAYLGESLEVIPEAIVFADDDELVESVAITDFAIASVPFEDELSELPVTVLSIDGIEPSAENIQSGAYPMSISLGVVVSQTPSLAVDEFLAFVNSEEGQQLLKSAEAEDEDED